MRFPRGAVLVLAAAVASPALAEDGAESIEALSARLEQVASLRDMLPLVYPEDRMGVALMLGTMAGMAAAFAEDPEPVTREYEEVLAKHGLEELAAEDGGPAPGASPEQRKAEAARLMEGVDIGAFVTDIAAFMGRHSEAGAEPPVPAGRLEGVEVDGDTATATLNGQPAPLIRVDGRWYLRAEF